MFTEYQGFQHQILNKGVLTVWLHIPQQNTFFKYTLISQCILQLDFWINKQSHCWIQSHCHISRVMLHVKLKPITYLYNNVNWLSTFYFTVLIYTHCNYAYSITHWLNLEISSIYCNVFCFNAYTMANEGSNISKLQKAYMELHLLLVIS